ncbi:uncharacterized protein LOC122233237 [Panthera tigris]|uniref:uncharacterized protein LOC122233237 n=1 Tax=Panthera tigris TaxID=9694 RepID=UPI001C6F7E3E|nr:uncharacterized protein LOC122233237 [Panthera tigris]
MHKFLLGRCKEQEPGCRCPGDGPACTGAGFTASHDVHLTGFQASLGVHVRGVQASHNIHLNGFQASHDVHLNGFQGSHDVHLNGFQASLGVHVRGVQAFHNIHLNGFQASHDVHLNGFQASHDVHLNGFQASHDVHLNGFQASHDVHLNGFQASLGVHIRGVQASHNIHLNGFQSSHNIHLIGFQASHDIHLYGFQASHDVHVTGFQAVKAVCFPQGCRPPKRHYRHSADAEAEPREPRGALHVEAPGTEPRGGTSYLRRCPGSPPPPHSPANPIPRPRTCGTVRGSGQAGRESGPRARAGSKGLCGPEEGPRSLGTRGGKSARYLRGPPGGVCPAPCPRPLQTLTPRRGDLGCPELFRPTPALSGVDPDKGRSRLSPSLPVTASPRCSAGAVQPSPLKRREPRLPRFQDSSTRRPVWAMPAVDGYPARCPLLRGGWLASALRGTAGLRLPRLAADSSQAPVYPRFPQLLQSRQPAA